LPEAQAPYQPAGVKVHTMRKTILLIGFLFVAPLLAEAQSRSVEPVINYAKRLDVSRLDGRLTSQRYGDWVEKVVAPGAEIKWEANDCGEQTGSPADRNRAIPLCAGVQARLADGRVVSLQIAVGTQSKGINGRPVFRFGLIEQPGQSVVVNKLSELPGLLKSQSK
jgi:hypothetical protein